MIGWSGRVDIDGNTYQFLHSGQGNNAGHYSNPTVDKLLDEARGTDRPGEAAATLRADVAELRAGSAAHLSVERAQHRRDVGEAERLPSGARRHDPHPGPGDGEVVRGHLGTRIAQIIPTLLLVSVLVFCLQQLMPGDPALVMAGEERGDPQVLAQIRAELWLDRSLPVQYLHWMGNVLQGNLGFSWRIRQPVAQLVLQKLPVTLQLGIDGVRHRGADRRAGGHRRRGVPQRVLGLRRQRGRAGGPVHAEFLARHHADPADLGAAGLAAAVGLRAADRGLAAVARHHDHAGLRAGQRDRRGADAAYAECDADRRWIRTMCAPRAPRGCASSSW